VLLAVNPSAAPLRVNGTPAPQVALLREKDHVAFGAAAFFVAVFHRPRIGAPPEALIGKECPVCLGPITASARVYVCSGCGSALHCDADENNPEALQCARLSNECVVCSRPIGLTEKFNWLPDHAA
jgi:hypothetical protein